MRRSIIAGWCAYLVLASSGWILQLAFPASLPAADQNLSVLLAALLWPLLSRPRWSELDPRLSWPAIASGLLLFALPTLLLPLSEHGLPAFTRIALLALVPVCLSVVTASRESSRFDLLTLLAPSLGGLAGVFLLLPASPELLLQSPRATAATAATILSIAIGSYTAHLTTRPLPLRSSLILLLAPSLVVLASISAMTHQGPPLPTLGDLPTLLWGAAEISLLVLLLRTIAPIALSTRYLLVPLLTTIEGCILLKPPLTFRMLFAIASLAVSAALLIGSGRPQPDSPMSLPR